MRALAAGVEVRPLEVQAEKARHARGRRREAGIRTLDAPLPPAPRDDAQACASPVLAVRDAEGDAPCVAYRQAGDRYVLVEYGPQVLDLELRFRVHALMTALEAAALPGAPREGS